MREALAYLGCFQAAMREARINTAAVTRSSAQQVPILLLLRY